MLILVVWETDGAIGGSGWFYKKQVSWPKVLREKKMWLTYVLTSLDLHKGDMSTTYDIFNLITLSLTPLNCHDHKFTLIQIILTIEFYPNKCAAIKLREHKWSSSYPWAKIGGGLDALCRNPFCSNLYMFFVATFWQIITHDITILKIYQKIRTSSLMVYKISKGFQVILNTVETRSYFLHFQDTWTFSRMENNTRERYIYKKIGCHSFGMNRLFINHDITTLERY